MLLKYKHGIDIGVTEITDAAIDNEANCIQFVPNNSVILIQLNNQNRFSFEKIIDDLFTKGKADITRFGDVEILDRCEDYE